MLCMLWGRCVGNFSAHDLVFWENTIIRWQYLLHNHDLMTCLMVEGCKVGQNNKNNLKGAK